jgi:hypothetical protein
MPLNGMERLEGCSQWNSMPGYDAPVKPHPEQPVCREKPKPTFALPPEDGDLVPQGDKLKFQAGAATKAEGKKRNESGKNRHHAQDGMAVARKSPAVLDLSEF